MNKLETVLELQLGGSAEEKKERIKNFLLETIDNCKRTKAKVENQNSKKYSYQLAEHIKGCQDLIAQTEKILADPNAFKNYAARFYQNRINEHLSILRFGRLSPLDTSMTTYNSTEMIERYNIWGIDGHDARIFLQQFKSPEKYREYLYGMAGLEFVPIERYYEVRKENPVLANNLSSKAGIYFEHSDIESRYPKYGITYSGYSYETYINNDRFPNINGFDWEM